MCSNVCRACLRPLSDPNDVVHIFEQLYKNKHNIALLLSDIIRLKVGLTTILQNFLIKTKLRHMFLYCRLSKPMIFPESFAIRVLTKSWTFTNSTRCSSNRM